jgi:hypothetical protein
LECIDRIYLNPYEPKLMWPGGVVGFFKGHRQMPFASSALMDPISKEFVADIHRFIKNEGLDLVHFAAAQRKDDVALAYLAEHDGTEGVLFVGRAQEKTEVFRTEKRRNPVTGSTYPWIVTGTSIVNHFYIYAFDDDFGPFFIKFGTYLPLHRLLLHQRPSLRPAPSGQGRDRLRGVGQRLRLMSGHRRPAGHLQLAQRRADRRVRPQMVRPTSPSVPRRGPGRRLHL